MSSVVLALILAFFGDGAVSLSASEGTPLLALLSEAGALRLVEEDLLEDAGAAAFLLGGIGMR